MSVHITYAWHPFAAKLFTMEETSAAIREACLEWSKICGLTFSSNVHPVLIFSGAATTAWSGATYQNRIWISTLRDLTYEQLVMACMHEIGHTWGDSRLPNLSHLDDDPARDHLMNPAGSRWNWFGPRETAWAQYRYGFKRFAPEPLVDWTARRDRTLNQRTIAKMKRKRLASKPNSKEFKQAKAEHERLKAKALYEHRAVMYLNDLWLRRAAEPLVESTEMDRGPTISCTADVFADIRSERLWLRSQYESDDEPVTL